MIYCRACKNCSDCFACVGLQHKQYCLFNTQYSKGVYEQLVEKVLSHMMGTKEWGEFFDPSVSLFGYNETVAQEYFPLTSEEALKKGFQWYDGDAVNNVANNVHVIDWKNPPNNLVHGNCSDVQDVKSYVFLCEVSGKAYTLTEQELLFYHKHQLALPRRHPNIRHQERLAKRPGSELFLRQCSKTGRQIISSYPPDTNFDVFDHQVFDQEMFG